MLLIVEDEREIREILADDFKDHGFSVLQARNGEEAKKLIQENRIEIVISDFKMPTLDGEGLLKWIKDPSSKLTSQPEVILISGFSKLSAKKAFNLGAKGYFSKPFSFDLVLNRVNDLLRYRQIDPETDEDLIERFKEKKINVFFADDDVKDRDLLKKAIDEGPFSQVIDLQMFDDGNQILNEIHRLDSEKKPFPDVVFLDVNMPQKNGFEVLADAKKHERIGKIPFIVLSTSAREEDFKRAYENGADSYFVKPWEFEPWKHLVRSVVQSWSKRASS